MEFDSLVFLFVFFPVFLFLYFLLQQEIHNAVLLLASLVFYFWGQGQWIYLFLMIISVNYGLGRILDASKSRIVRKSVFISSLVINLGVLIYYRYAFFFLSTIGLTSAASGRTEILFPLGISFIAFQAVSFVTDVYRRSAPMDKNPFRFGLYLALFPKILSGPLTPYRNLAPQIQAARVVTQDDMIVGVRRIIFGLGKKMLLADILSIMVNKVFAIPSADLTASLAWLGIVCFTLEIFFDFAGYTDIAIGLGLLCGFKLPENFNYPYLAESITDFWKRWHMSLSRWLQDYLFLPISYAVSRKIKSPRLLNVKAEYWAYLTGVFITFLICGLWHGPNWTFVVWGGYYGFLLAVEQVGLRKWLKRRWGKPWRIVATMFFVMMGWVLFRSPTLGGAFSYFKALFGFGSGDGIRYYPGLYLNAKILLAMLAGTIGIFPFFPKIARMHSNWTNAWANRHHSLRLFILKNGSVLIYNLFLLLVSLSSLIEMAGETHRPFLYLKF